LFRVVRGKKEKYYVHSDEVMKQQLLEKGLSDSRFVDDQGTVIEGDQMRKLCTTLASVEEAILALERRGISLRTHSERMDPQTLRMPVYHLVYKTEEHWFTTREQLDGYLKSRNIATEATTIDSLETEEKLDPDGDGQLYGDKPYIIELHEVRTINGGLKELEAFGYGIEQLLPKDRTGFTEPRFRLLREEAEIGLEDLRALLPAIRSAGEKGLQITRFKGLGEMNAEELRETTLDPSNRTMIKVTLVDAAAADEMFRVLMGDKVEPRRQFIEKHALDVKNLDV
jgi:DNA gyrase subunit B